MQSHYIYALLSNNTYHNATYNLPPGWKEFKGTFPILTSSDNFYAVPYVNEVLKKIIIAFRGSDTWKNYAADDIEIFVNLAPPLFLNKAIPFVEAVITEAIRQHPDFEISFTGHSLGAVIAELCAANYNKPAVTFESPGSKNMIVDLTKKKQLPSDALVTTRIVSYQAAISAINRINPYLGTRYRLYPELTYPDFPVIHENLAGLAVDDRCDPNDMPTDTTFIAYSISQHHMSKLLAQFDPEMGALVYSEFSLAQSSGYSNAFNAWKNYDENRYYWDQVIETIYYPLCGSQQTKQAFKNAYIAKWLTGSTNPVKQTGVTIYAPGSAQYPALSIWGTTNGKDTLIFGKGKFKVIAYGFNTYKFTRDAEVSCDVEQMTMDNNRESSLFIGDQGVQGYALNYNTPSAFKPTLYLSNGLKVPWVRTPGETKETHHISIGDSAAISDPDFAVDFPTVRFSNSPSGQFNILTGEVYQHNNPIWQVAKAASSKGLIYSLVYEIEEGIDYWVLYQLTLLGDIVTRSKVASYYSMSECFDVTDDEFPAYYIQFYEKEEVLHFFFKVYCHKEKYLDADGNIAFTDYLSPETDEYSTAQCSNYMDIVEYIGDGGDNKKVIFSCGGISRCLKERKKTLEISFQFDNFEVDFQCDTTHTAQTSRLMTSMRYPLQSGYTFVLTNPDVYQKFSLWKSDAFILDCHNNRLFTFLSSLSDDPNHVYFPSAVLPNGDMLIVGGRLSYSQKEERPDFALTEHSYAIYWETSSLAYFKLLEATPVSMPTSTLLSASALLAMTQQNSLNLGLVVLLAVNMMLIRCVAKKATKHASQYATSFFSERRSSNVPLRQAKDNDAECQLLPFDTDKKQDGYDTFSEITSSTSSQEKVSSHQKNKNSALITFSIHNKNKFVRPTTPENDRAQNKKMCAVM